MTQADAEAKLKLALKRALMLGDDGISVLTIANRVYDAEREIIGSFNCCVGRICNGMEASIAIRN